MLVLHANTRSLAGRRLLKVLALKGTPFGLVDETPEFGLVGGIAPSACLQYGRHIYAGCALAILAIDRLHPEPGLFPNGNRGMPLALDVWSDVAAARGIASAKAFAAHAALIARQLEDGRSWLQGERPGLADIEAWSFLDMCLSTGRIPPRSLADWFARVAELGTGDIRPMVPGTCDIFPADAPAAPTFVPMSETRRQHHPRLGEIVVELPLF